MMGEDSHAHYCHVCHVNGFSHKGPALARQRHEGDGMTVLTINIPTLMREQLDALVCGDNCLYPSRSEVIRVALRQFLQEEIVWRDRLLEPVETPPSDPMTIQFSDGQTVRLKVAEQGGMHP
jgi:Arc/MetJ-type ribon-helix-helix transcriptional regulator